MNLQMITPPVGEPVTLDDVKRFLKIDTTADDTLLLVLIAAARETCENYTGRKLLGQSWQWTLNSWGDGEVILPSAPVLTIEAVDIYSAGGFTALDPAAYQLDTTFYRPRLLAVNGARLPDPDIERGGIRITFRAGYGETADKVPVSLTQGILHWIAATFEAQEAMLDYELAERLWQPYRMVKL
ncbi:head-tail connector protein [Luteithermobacter gelatinilyticus]|uniref:head-tail connector protein n=1 Tax=Luteithermobacter gelatinilyticus TaxID=2582913 RepID=UPI0011060691|nr:head-tail connector protein [Luteithermobacter gelatinilyticus]